jgi:leucyl/phenylalanyl-tRNA--protein transferase
MRNRQITWISADDPPQAFPPAQRALGEPDGLLAAGGDLTAERLLYAYRHGIFPWYDEGQPILWWSPDPRCILPRCGFHLSRRMRRALRRSDAVITFNRDFDAVIDACAGPRRSQQGTWITADMQRAYQHLHRLGWAHSIEIWDDGRLTGGVYGLAIGKAFFGESMFSRDENASKFALHCLCEILWPAGFLMLDCQVVSQHLLTLGAVSVSRDTFLKQLDIACDVAAPFRDWPEKSLKIQQFAPK